MQNSQKPLRFGGSAYVFSGETEENLKAALIDYRDALEKDETFSSAWIGLADVYIRSGEYAQALAVMREAAIKSGNSPAVMEKLSEMENGIFIDSSGRDRRIEYRDDDGNLEFYLVYDFNPDGTMSRCSHYDADDTLVLYDVFS